MSINDNNIDKLFQDAENKQSFNFDDAYWLEMQALLLIQKKKKPVLLVISLVFGTLLVLSTLFWTNKKTVYSKSPVLEKSSEERITKKDNLDENITNDNTKIINVSLSNNSKIESQKIAQNSSSIKSSVKQNKVVLNRKSKKKTEEIASNIANENIESKLTNQGLIKSLNEVPKTDKSTTDNASIELLKVRSSQKINEIELNKNIAFYANTLKLKNNVHNLYYSFGIGLGQALILENSKPNLAFNLGFGHKTDFKNWGLKTALNLNVLQTNGLKMLKETIEYGTTVTKLTQTNDVSQLVSLQLPILIYGAVKRQVVFAGVAPGINLLMWSRQTNLRNNEIESNTRGLMKTQEFKKLSLDLKVGYAFQLKPKTQLGIEMTTRATNTFNNVNSVNPKSLPIIGTLFLHLDL